MIDKEIKSIFCIEVSYFNINFCPILLLLLLLFRSSWKGKWIQSFSTKLVFEEIMHDLNSELCEISDWN